MKMPKLFAALAFTAVTATSLALPATASASSFMDEATRKVHGEHYRDAKVRPVHYKDRYDRRQDYRGHKHSRWAPSRDRHDRGHHYGHHKHSYRYDYRPVERDHHRYGDDLRVRILYDLVL